MHNEIVKSGLIHYALITGFNANCLSAKQSLFFDFYQHAALSMLMGIANGECQKSTRYAVLDRFFDRAKGNYCNWVDDVIDAVRSKKSEGQRIRSFDTYFVSSMRDPYAGFCKPNLDTLRNIEKRLDLLRDSYLLKRKIVKQMVMEGEFRDVKPKLAIFM